MHRVRALAVSLCVSLAGCGPGCDPTALEALQSELGVAPAEVAVVAWVGHAVTASFTVTNTGRAPLEVVSASVDAVALDATFDVDVGLEATPLAPGASAHIDVVVRAAAPATAALLLRVTTLDREVATALIHVDARVPPTCAPTDSCATAAFDPAIGLCVLDPRPDGEGCDDASACTDDDRCSAGTCVGRAVTCADDVGCTVDACDPARGCVFQPVNERCADDNPCSDDVCDPSLSGEGCRSTTSADGTPCGPFSCAELSTCILGSCFTTPTPDGFPCEDGDLCTQGDVCQAQQCTAGDPVEPSAALPVLLTRPAVHVVQDARWFQTELDDAMRPPFDVTPGFDVVLDIAQGVVGLRPTLAVLWRTTPFDIDGQPCAPWDMWAAPADDASFCASAVVVTFVDELELAQATGAVGDSVVLDVIYGTASAAFGPRASVTADELRVVIAESTYAPAPNAGRELHVECVTLSLGSRAIVARVTERLASGPHSAVETNVHAGLRLALDDVGEGIVGWDLPQLDVVPNLPSDEADPDSEPPDRANVVPTIVARLDVAALTLAPPDAEPHATWLPVLEDQCLAMPVPAEEVAWHDVDVARESGVTYVLVRHDALDGELGCSEFSTPTLLTGLMVAPDGSAATLSFSGALSSSLGSGASVLARIVELPLACADLDCAPFALEIFPTPFNQSDPVVTLRRALIGVPDRRPGRVAVLGVEAGVFGAVVAERGLTDGLLRLRLVDDVDHVDEDGAAGLDLVTAPFAAPDTALRALRSPLSPQRVYAVTTSGVGVVADGVVVRFGCSFPTLP